MRATLGKSVQYFEQDGVVTIDSIPNDTILLPPLAWDQIKTNEAIPWWVAWVGGVACRRCCCCSACSCSAIPSRDSPPPPPPPPPRPPPPPPHTRQGPGPHRPAVAAAGRCVQHRPAQRRWHAHLRSRHRNADVSGVRGWWARGSPVRASDGGEGRGRVDGRWGGLPPANPRSCQTAAES